MSQHRATTYYYYPHAGAQSGDNQWYITPARKLLVDFDLESNTKCRPARDNERDAMQRFATHVSHCPSCIDPYCTLCDRGAAYAKDVGQYVYSKAGKAHSVIDRNASDARVQIEIPRGCDAIRGLLVAVVSQDRTYHVPDRRHLRDAYDVLEATPRGCEERRRGDGGDRRRDTVHVSSGEGACARRMKRSDGGEDRSRAPPVIVHAEPDIIAKD